MGQCYKKAVVPNDPSLLYYWQWILRIEYSGTKRTFSACICCDWLANQIVIRLIGSLLTNSRACPMSLVCHHRIIYNKKCVCYVIKFRTSLLDLLSS